MLQSLKFKYIENCWNETCDIIMQATKTFVIFNTSRHMIIHLPSKYMMFCLCIVKSLNTWLFYNTFEEFHIKHFEIELYNNNCSDERWGSLAFCFSIIWFNLNSKYIIFRNFNLNLGPIFWFFSNDRFISNSILKKILTTKHYQYTKSIQRQKQD